MAHLATKYHLPVIKSLELSAGRRLDLPSTRVPLFYGPDPVGKAAVYDGERYRFELEGEMAEMMDANRIRPRFDYDIWDERDRSRPNSRIVAIVLEDRTA
jgi:hypothetical protein